MLVLRKDIAPNLYTTGLDQAWFIIIAILFPLLRQLKPYLFYKYIYKQIMCNTFYSAYIMYLILFCY